jgi:hypothetical protein
VYNPVTLWEPALETGNQRAASLYSSNEFIAPERHDVNSAGGRTISFLTKPLVIEKVEDATYENLIKMKEQVLQGYRDGHSLIDKKGYFSKVAKRTIEDIMTRIYEEQATLLFHQGRTLPPRKIHDWLDWPDTKFFEKIPPLLRLEQAIQEDPMSDCITQLPLLTYTYEVKNNTGEARFHDDTNTVFRNTLVWVSEEEDETQAIWFTNPEMGRKWLRNILRELNFIIARGKGVQKIVKMISLEMNKLEKNYPSGSFGDFMKQLKAKHINFASRHCCINKQRRRSIGWPIHNR